MTWNQGESDPDIVGSCERISRLFFAITMCYGCNDAQLFYNVSGELYYAIVPIYPIARFQYLYLMTIE